MQFQKQNLDVLAVGSVTGSSGAFTCNRGFTTCVRNSAGNYTLTLEAGGPGAANDDSETVAFATAKGTTAVHVRTTQATTTIVVSVVRNSTGAEFDADFDVVLARKTN